MDKQQEPKYGIKVNGNAEMVLYNRESGEVIPEDEPVFILRARDKHAAIAIADYAKRVRIPEHEEAVMARCQQFCVFATEHPRRMKEPDTTQPDRSE